MFIFYGKCLPPSSLEEIKNEKYQYAAVLSQEEWAWQNAGFEMGIELELNVKEIHSTKAEVNYDSMTGTFLIPDREDLTGNTFSFAYALDEKGIVFIDDSGKADEMIGAIRQTKKWRQPCLEIFMPLTLIAGWYGMNFRYMPELEAPYGYLIVIVISAIIAAGSLIYFKVKKWL